MRKITTASKVSHATWQRNGGFRTFLCAFMLEMNIFKSSQPISDEDRFSFNTHWQEAASSSPFGHHTYRRPHSLFRALLLKSWRPVGATFQSNSSNSMPQKTGILCSKYSIHLIHSNTIHSYIIVDRGLLYMITTPVWNLLFTMCNDEMLSNGITPSFVVQVFKFFGGGISFAACCKGQHCK